MPGDIGKAFAQHLSVVRSRSGTAETGVVVLITQRSQVQILPPLPNVQVRGLFRLWKRPSCCGVLTSLLTALPPRDVSALLTVPPGLLTNSGRLADRVGIRAGSGSGLPHSWPGRAATREQLVDPRVRADAGRWAQERLSPRDACWCPERPNSRSSVVNIHVPRSA
jgi:hypothetical protein